jgi:glycosyltransferase involved in cell wall biosynthesis
LKIWIVNQYAVPPTQAGITRSHAYARELISNGHEVIIIASSFSYLTHSDPFLKRGEKSKYEKIEGVPFYWIRTPPYQENDGARIRNMLSFAFQLTFTRTLKKLPAPDLIFASSPPLLGAWPAAILAKRLRVPFVFEVRDLWPQTLIDLGNVSPRHPTVRLLARLERYLYKAATRIVSVLPRAVEHMVQKGANAENVVWIPNGVNLEQIPVPTAPVEKETFTLMYAGAHGVANGLHSILDAAALCLKQQELQNVRFLFVGAGQEKALLQERVRNEKLVNVEFRDPVPKKNIAHLLNEADCFLMTLCNSPVFRWGISPNKLFDYLAAGRPILFSVDAPQNPVAEAEAGITVPPEDAPAMVEAIKTFLALSPEERWSMGLRGRRHIEQHYDLKLLGERLHKTLVEALPPGKSARLS